MKAMRITTLFLALLILCPMLLQADDRGPSTPEERTRFNALVKRLVDSPLDPPKKEETAWAIKLGIEIPDFTVNLCAGDGMTTLSGYKRHDSLFILYTLAPLAVQFQYAESAKDQPAIDALTWNWILDAYETIISTKPKDTLKFLEDALTLRKAGKMSEFVGKVSCAQGKDWHEPPTWALNPSAPASAPTPASTPASAAASPPAQH